MDFFTLIAQRRSIRKYKKQPVEADKIAKITEAALRAPSSRNLQSTEFIIVTEQATIARLAQARPHSSTFLCEAPVAVVVCADPENAMSGLKMLPLPPHTYSWQQKLWV